MSISSLFFCYLLRRIWFCFFGLGSRSLVGFLLVKRIRKESKKDKEIKKFMWFEGVIWVKVGVGEIYFCRGVGER